MAAPRPAGAGTPPPPPDYFALLGVRPGFAIDAAALTAAYRRLQRAHHPDVAAAAAAAAPASASVGTSAGASSSGERRVAAPPPSADDLSATINAAYATLRSPAARARYLLRRAGVSLPGDDDDTAPGAGGEGGGGGGAGGAGTRVRGSAAVDALDADFLEWVMEARLALEAATDGKAVTAGRTETADSSGVGVEGGQRKGRSNAPAHADANAEADADAPLRALLAEVTRVEAEVCAGLEAAFDGRNSSGVGEGEGVRLTMAAAKAAGEGGREEAGGEERRGNGDGDGDEGMDVDAATLGTARLQYLQRLRREIRERMDE
ncbi:hypothetical protein MMPV_006162 [Pyropia vietnamensis]